MLEMNDDVDHQRVLVDVVVDDAAVGPQGLQYVVGGVGVDAKSGGLAVHTVAEGRLLQLRLREVRAVELPRELMRAAGVRGRHHTELYRLTCLDGHGPIRLEFYLHRL